MNEDNESGLVLKLNFSGINKYVLRDLSGLNNDAFLGSEAYSPKWVEDSDSGNKVLMFDGKDDYIIVKNSPSLQMNKNTSISSLLKFHDQPAGWGLIAERYDGFGFGSGYGETNVRFNVWTPLENSTKFSPEYALNEWHFFVGTYDVYASSRQQKFYIDGVLYNERDTEGNISNINNCIFIGAGRDSSYPSPICLKDFRVWNRVIKPNEIKMLHRKIIKTG